MSRVRLGVDLARRIFSAPDTASAATCSRSTCLARLHFLLDLGLGGGDQAVALGLGLRLRLLDALAGGLLGGGDDLLGALARIA